MTLDVNNKRKLGKTTNNRQLENFEIIVDKIFFLFNNNYEGYELI